MKKILCLAAGLLALNFMPVFAQPAPPPPMGTPNYQQRLNAIIRNANGSSPADAPALTKFNLDFPGGTPAELVKAIEKAMGKPLNVIISADEKSLKAKLPPVRVTDMDVARLFDSLKKQKWENNEQIYGEGFYTKDEPPKDNSLWTFNVYEKQSALTKFDLDFPGGTPAQLVKAIEKGTGRPLNVVIPDADADTKLPPLKMDNVDVAQLFQALEKASVRQVAFVTGNYGFVGGNQSYSTYSMGYGFKTDGQPTDNSVWYFHADKPVLPPMVSDEKACQFYSLSSYLDRGFTVDDITTAIQTGWKMTGTTPTPELNYHKETKMLIAYGEPGKLKTIDDVLKTLPRSNITVPESKMYWDYIQGLQDQINLLKKKIGVENSPTNAPEEKAGK